MDPDSGSFGSAPGANEYVAEQGLSVSEIPGGYQVRDKSGLRRNFTLKTNADWYLLTSQEDPHGNRLVFDYDGVGNLVTMTKGGEVPPR